MKTRGPVVVALGLAIIVAACGGGANDGGQPPASAAAPSQPGVDAAPSEPGAEGQPSTAAEPSGGAPAAPAGTITATVTIGGVTFQFSGSEADRTGSCGIWPDGSFSGGGHVPGGDFISMTLLPEGWAGDPERPQVVASSVDVSGSGPGTPIWTSEGRVDTFEFSASGASGTATFIDTESPAVKQGGTGEPVPGTFEISCG